MKRVLSSVCFLVFLWVTSICHAGDLNNGLILHYTFNANEGGTVSDKSGQGHQGSVHGATHTPDGRLGGAYHFDGDDYILAGNLGYQATGSISFWINADEAENWRNPFSTDYASWDDNIRFEVSSNGRFGGGGHGLGRGENNIPFTTSFVAKRWYHVAYIWDEDYVYGYLDGELKFKNLHPPADSYVHPNIKWKTAGEFKVDTLTFSNVAIGNGYSTSPERYWKGKVDEVRIYERPLSQEEVVLLFKDPEDGLVLHYSFDTDEGGTVPDQSGQGNTGAVNGALYTADGKVGGAYQFNGSPHHIIAGNLGFHEAGTISFWMYPDIVENWRNPFSTDYASWDDNIRFEETSAGLFYGGGHGLGRGEDGSAVPFTTSLAANRWYHVVYAWDEDFAYGYFDGELKFKNPHPPADSYVHPDITWKTAGEFKIDTLTFSNVAVGNGYSTHPERYWKGKVDEVRIYERALSEQEVRALNNQLTHGKVFQDFEAGNGTPGLPPDYCDGINGATADVSEVEFHSGAISCGQTTSSGNWGGITVEPQDPNGFMDFEPERHDRLAFWIYPLPAQGPNNVSVRFFDDDLYDGTPGKPGFEVWTTKKVESGGWAKLHVLFTQLPGDFNLHYVDKIEFVNFWPGTYYFDDIHVTSEDRIFQAFEQDPVDNPTPGYPGGVWDGTADYSGPGEPVYEGQHSWKLVSHPGAFWSGVWTFSQERRCVHADTCSSQEYRNVDLNPLHLNPQQYDRLTFWVYQLGENGMSNNIHVQFFDHGNYSGSPADFWTEKNGEYAEWTRLEVPFNALPDDFNVQDIDKIEFQAFWPGTYYFDDVRAAKSPSLVIDKTFLPSGVVSWNEFVGAARYTLQENTSGPIGPWTTTAYAGPESTFTLNHLAESWLRVRWETAPDSGQIAPYASDWSDAVHYIPKPVLIRHSKLQQGILEWTDHPLAISYEVEEGDSRDPSDPDWTQIHSGEWTTITLSAGDLGKWYRVRAIGAVDAGAWSPALSYDPTGYVHAVGKKLREKQGTGDVVILKGINLGNYLLIEPWMLGDGSAFQEIFPDDWTIREQMGDDADSLVNFYQDVYIRESDFDNLLHQESNNVIRLPIYYRNIRDLDDEGEWVGNGFNFDKIDRIVNTCADRGIYVLLDLHGVPGGQSKEFHTGRESVEDPSLGYFHQLFDPIVDTYRQRTIELWTAIAEHFKDHTMVVGYDLLNEPTGVDYYSPGDPSPLWALYDDLYHAIRDNAGDDDHVIVMEGVWDWNTLPNPSDYSWDNVMYQFHFYCWEPPEGSCPAWPPEDQLNSQKAFIDQKIAESHPIQEIYNVPVLIGEFNGFGLKDVWTYYITKFNSEGWSWAPWSYKLHEYSSNWGLYNHFLYDEELPDFSLDSIEDLTRKLGKYDTPRHHVPNTSLIKTITEYSDITVTQAKRKARKERREKKREERRARQKAKREAR